jgi:hypothetical protein
MMDDCGRGMMPWLRLVAMLMALGVVGCGYDSTGPMSDAEIQRLSDRTAEHTILNVDAWPDNVAIASIRLRTDIRGAIALIGEDPSGIEPDLGSLTYPIAGVKTYCASSDYEYNADVDFSNYNAPPMVEDTGEIRFKADPDELERMSEYWSEIGYDVIPSELASLARQVTPAFWSVSSVESSFGHFLVLYFRDADEYEVTFWSECGPLVGEMDT